MQVCDLEEDCIDIFRRQSMLRSLQQSPQLLYKLQRHRTPTTLHSVRR